MNIKISSESLSSASQAMNRDVSELLVKNKFARAVYSVGEGKQKSLSLEAMSLKGMSFLEQHNIAYDVK